MDASRLSGFFGSLLIVALAIGIFFMLMSTDMPASNRELLIAFVSVLFGAMSTSIKKITGDDDNQLLKELRDKNAQLEKQLKDLTEKH